MRKTTGKYVHAPAETGPGIQDSGTSRKRTGDMRVSADNRLQFETLLSNLSARFVNVPAERLDQEIQDALKRVLEFFQVDRCALLKTLSDRKSWQVVFVAYADGIPPVPEKTDLPMSLFPWISGQLLEKQEVVFFKALDDLPPEADIDRQTYRAWGIKSNLNIPILIGGPTDYILAINAVSRECAWPEDYIPRLRVLGEVFVNALERRRFDQALRESEACLSLAADSAGAGLWSMKIDTSLVSVSARMRELFGFTEDEELKYDSFLKVIHPEDREKVHLCVEQAVRARGELNIEYRIALPDGIIRWIAARGRLHRASSGEVGRLMGLSVDITGRKHAEEARLESMERYHAMVEAFDGLLYICSPDYRVEFMNQRMIERTGRNAVGEICYKALHDRDSVCEWCVNERVFRGETVRWEVQSPKDHRWYYVVNTPIRHADGTTSKQSMIIDITERKRMEEQLQDRLDEIERLKQQIERENICLRQDAKLLFEHDRIVGGSEALRKVLAQVEQVARTDATVLLLGETGTGKELIAHALHNLSKRKDRVMVKVNCASLPAALIESELFGREKGAYTGALTKQIGRFELADGSTIFLDEIAELPLELQVKLLRILQDGTFERLGSPKAIRTDARVIAATNRDLAEAVRKGTFREDLYYRLNVFPIEVPPLRERPDDIPLLVEAFVSEFSGKMGRKIGIVPGRTVEALQRYHWPGNVRELRNVIEQAVIISDTGVLNVKIPQGLNGAASGVLSLEEAEYLHIMGVLQKTGWRIKGRHGAAELLGLKPSTLYTKMEKLGIPKWRDKDGMTT